jgi:Cu+-exporting ATPase
MSEIELDVRGMTCAACVGRVEKALNAVDGVASARVNLVMERATITTAADVSTDRLVAAVADAGYEAAPRTATPAPHAAPPDATHEERRALVTAVALTIPLLAIGMAHGVSFFASDGAKAVQLLLATLVVFGPGRRFFTRALAALRHGAADMNVLVALGVAASWAWSTVAVVAPGIFPHAAHGARPHVYFEAAGSIVTFVLLGKMLEARAKKRLRDAVTALVALAPSRAHRLADANVDVTIDVDVAALSRGDRVLVRPGERVPVDGKIERGDSSLDESLLTGESMPRDKGPGDDVVGGSLNGAGALVVRATALGSESAVARIAEAVERAQATKPKLALFADRVSAIFVPIVVLLSVITFGVWLLVDPTSDGLAVAIERSVAVLVIACPCALGLATPAAVAAATGRGAELGILLRSSAALERAEAVTKVLLDKTGTVTRGRPELVRIDSLGPRADAGAWFALVAALESRSEHPLARAITAGARAQGVVVDDVVDAFRATAGGGVEGDVAGHRILAGTVKWLGENGVDVADAIAPATAHALAGRTPVVAAVDGELAGIAAIADAARPEARAVVAALRAEGRRVALVTGDRVEAARAIGAELGIDEILAEVLPDGKAAAVAYAREGGAVVAMVGDGVNDAPALAAADVGVAIGEGADVAIAVADVALLGGGIARLPAALSLGRATMRTIRRNFFWAFAYNVLGIPLAAGVLFPWTGWSLSPVVAGAAMSLSSVSVLLSSLYLRRFGRGLNLGRPR